MARATMCQERMIWYVHNRNIKNEIEDEMETFMDRKME